MQCSAGLHPRTPTSSPTFESWRQGLEERVKRSEDVLAFAEDAVSHHPTDPVLLGVVCLAALVGGDAEKCLRYQKRLRKRYVPEPVDDLLRALALAERGQYQLARKILNKGSLVDLETAIHALPFCTPKIAEWFVARHAKITDGCWGKPNQNRMRRVQKKGKNRERLAHPPRKMPALALEPIKKESFGSAPRLPYTDVEVPVQFTLEPFPKSVAPAESTWFEIRRELSRLSLFRGFDELLSLPTLNGVEAYAHQIETVRKVLKHFRGRVLLADEVGLGKTIEAGMVIKEYILRGMVTRTLILTPPSLVSQWQEELSMKFGLDFVTTHSSALRQDTQAFWREPRLIASVATARRPEHQKILRANVYDLVVVDEAHRLKNSSSRSYQLVNHLQKRFILLLSATPVQNSLIELYNLLTLLKPGVFKTQKEFRARYMMPKNPRTPANPTALRDLMRDVMVRNTRSLVDVTLPPRHATTIRPEPDAEEKSCYAELNRLIRCAYQKEGARTRLGLEQLLVAAGSSVSAVVQSLEKMKNPDAPHDSWGKLLDRYQALSCGCKDLALMKLLAENPSEQKVVFVLRRATLEHLERMFKGAGISHGVFHGALTGAQKDEAIHQFKEGRSVLLTTESGGEGRNLQFANTLINFDLPWNPMAIEQRIGRIHRIGQERDVFIFNFAVKNTVEDHLLKILDEKINMFQLVVGEVGDILGELDETKDFSRIVFDAWTGSTQEKEVSALDAVAEQMVVAKNRLNSAKKLDEELFGDEFEAT